MPNTVATKYEYYRRDPQERLTGQKPQVPAGRLIIPGNPVITHYNQKLYKIASTTYQEPEYFNLKPNLKEQDEFLAYRQQKLGLMPGMPALQRMEYWEEPQRIVQYYHLLKSAPPTWEIPDWLNPEAISDTYQYLNYYNQGKDYDNWTITDEMQDGYQQLISNLKRPPNELLNPIYQDKEWQFYRNQKVFEQKLADRMAQYEEERLVSDDAEFQKKLKEELYEDIRVDYQKLPAWQQVLIATQNKLPTEKLKNVPEGVKLTQAGSAGLKAGLGAAGITSLFWSLIGTTVTTALAGGVAGTAATPAGSVIGAVAGGAVGLYTAIQAYRGEPIAPWLDRIFHVFNMPAEWVERRIGLMALANQGVNIGKLTKEERQIANLTYDVGVIPVSNVMTNLFSQITGGLGILESTGQTADISAGEVWAFEQGYVEPVSAYYGLSRGDVLNEALLRMQSGKESYDEIYWDIVQRFGYTGTRNDFIAQNFLDPMAVMPYAINSLGLKISKATHSEKAVAAFTDTRGKLAIDLLPMGWQQLVELVARKIKPDTTWYGTKGIFDTWRIYKEHLANALPRNTRTGYWDASDYNRFQKWAIGLDDSGHIENLQPVDTSQMNKFQRTANYLLTNTPETRAFNVSEKLQTNISRILEISKNADDVYKLVERFADNRIDVNKQETYFLKTPVTTSVSAALADFVQDPVTRTKHTVFMSAAGERKLLLDWAKKLNLEAGELFELMNRRRYDYVFTRMQSTQGNDFQYFRQYIDFNLLTDPVYHQNAVMTTFRLFETILRRKTDWSEQAYIYKYLGRMNDSINEYLGEKFNLGNDHWIIRMSKLFKTAQGLAILGLNPRWVAMNLFNNIATRAADGWFGFMTHNQINELVDSYDLNLPSRWTSEIDVNNKIYIKSIESDDILSRLTSKFSAFNRAVGIFGKLSNYIEDIEGKQTIMLAFSQYWAANWQPGLAYPKMTQGMVDVLAMLGYTPAQFYAIVSSATNRQQLQSLFISNEQQAPERQLIPVPVPEHSQGAETEPATFTPEQQAANIRAMLINKSIDDMLKGLYPDEETVGQHMALRLGLQKQIEDALIKNGDDIDAAIDMVIKKAQESIARKEMLDLEQIPAELMDSLMNEGSRAVVKSLVYFWTDDVSATLENETYRDNFMADYWLLKRQNTPESRRQAKHLIERGMQEYKNRIDRQHRRQIARLKGMVDAINPDSEPGNRIIHLTLEEQLLADSVYKQVDELTYDYNKLAEQTAKDRNRLDNLIGKVWDEYYKKVDAIETEITNIYIALFGVTDEIKDALIQLRSKQESFRKKLEHKRNVIPPGTTGETDNYVRHKAYLDYYTKTVAPEFHAILKELEETAGKIPKDNVIQTKVADFVLGEAEAIDSEFDRMIIQAEYIKNKNEVDIKAYETYVMHFLEDAIKEYFLKKETPETQQKMSDAILLIYKMRAVNWAKRTGNNPLEIFGKELFGFGQMGVEDVKYVLETFDEFFDTTPDDDVDIPRYDEFDADLDEEYFKTIETLYPPEEGETPLVEPPEEYDISDADVEKIRAYKAEQAKKQLDKRNKILQKDLKQKKVQVTGNITQNAHYGAMKNPDVKSDTLYDAIKAGERTAITMLKTDPGFRKYRQLLAARNRIFTISKDTGEYLYIRVTKPLHYLDENTDINAWSKLEGWSPEYYRGNLQGKVYDKLVYQFEFEYLKLEGKMDFEYLKSKSGKPVHIETEKTAAITQPAEPPIEMPDLGITGKKISKETVPGERQILIADSLYRKDIVSNDNKNAYMFTENLQAYLSIRNRKNELPSDVNKNPRLNVTDKNNQAGIRTNNLGEANKNARPIIVKKIQQDRTGKFVYETGEFTDSPEDIALFIKYNTEALDNTTVYIKQTNRNIIFPDQIAMGKSALPLEAADWLRNQLIDRFGITYTITPHGDKYGLKNPKLLSEQTKPSIPAAAEPYISTGTSVQELASSKMYNVENYTRLKEKYGSAGSFRLLEDGRALIRASEAANFRTCIHELLHVWTRSMRDEELEILVKAARPDMTIEKFRNLEFKLTHNLFRNNENDIQERYDIRAVDEGIVAAALRFIINKDRDFGYLDPIMRNMQGWLIELYKNSKQNTNINFEPEVADVFEKLITYDTQTIRERTNTEFIKEHRPINAVIPIGLIKPAKDPEANRAANIRRIKRELNLPLEHMFVWEKDANAIVLSADNEVLLGNDVFLDYKKRLTTIGYKHNESAEPQIFEAIDRKIQRYTEPIYRLDVEISADMEMIRQGWADDWRNLGLSEEEIRVLLGNNLIPVYKLPVIDKEMNTTNAKPTQINTPEPRTFPYLDKIVRNKLHHLTDYTAALHSALGLNPRAEEAWRLMKKIMRVGVWDDCKHMYDDYVALRNQIDVSYNANKITETEYRDLRQNMNDMIETLKANIKDINYIFSGTADKGLQFKREALVGQGWDSWLKTNDLWVIKPVTKKSKIKLPQNMFMPTSLIKNQHEIKYETGSNIIYPDNVQYYLMKNKIDYIVNAVFESKVDIPDKVNQFWFNRKLDKYLTGARTDYLGHINKNATGIVTKKYQQENDGYAAKTGQFLDTDADFDLFKKINTYLLDKLDTTNKNTIFVSNKIGFEDDAMPQRFAEWLKDEFETRFGVMVEVEQANNGFGIKIEIPVEEVEPATGTFKPLTVQELIDKALQNRLGEKELSYLDAIRSEKYLTPAQDMILDFALKIDDKNNFLREFLRDEISEFSQASKLFYQLFMDKPKGKKIEKGIHKQLIDWLDNLAINRKGSPPVWIRKYFPNYTDFNEPLYKHDQNFMKQFPGQNAKEQLYNAVMELSKVTDTNRFDVSNKDSDMMKHLVLALTQYLNDTSKMFRKETQGYFQIFKGDVGVSNVEPAAKSKTEIRSEKISAALHKKNQERVRAWQEAQKNLPWQERNKLLNKRDYHKAMGRPDIRKLYFSDDETIDTYSLNEPDPTWMTEPTPASNHPLPAALEEEAFEKFVRPFLTLYKQAWKTNNAQQQIANVRLSAKQIKAGTSNAPTSPGLPADNLPSIHPAQNMVAQLTPAQMKIYNDYINSTIIGYDDYKELGVRYAMGARDTALLNYNDRIGLDDIMDLAFPYQFWFTRTVGEWAKRIVNKPAIFAYYYRRNKALERIGEELEEEGNIPKRIQGKMKIPWVFKEPWMGDALYINPWGDFMPIENLIQPIKLMDLAAQSVNPGIYIEQMIDNGQITEEQGEEALASQSGDIWEMAYSMAVENNAKDMGDPSTIMSMMLSPSVIPTLISKGIGRAIRGEGDITTDPLPVMKTTMSIVAIGDSLGIIDGKNFVPEQGKKKTEIAWFGQWGDWLIDRELANMAVEDKQDWVKVYEAMMTHSGDIYQEAVNRLMKEVSLKMPGTLLADNIGNKNFNDLPFTLIYTLMPATIFPAGELEIMGLKEELKLAWDARANGYSKPLTEFFDKHPEYYARAALNDTPDMRYKKFMVSEIMDKYTSLDNHNKVIAKKKLGIQFVDDILAGEQIDYKTLDAQQLTIWAQMLNGYIPDAPEEIDAVIDRSKLRDMPEMDYFNQDEINTIERYYDEREKKFPDYSWMNRNYWSFKTDEERKEYLKRFPELSKYWTWNKEYKLSHPVLVRWLDLINTNYDTASTTPVEIKKPEPRTYYGINADLIDSIKDKKNALFPEYNWKQIIYFNLDKDKRKSFLANNPDLLSAWDWDKEMEELYPWYARYKELAELDFQMKALMPENKKTAELQGYYYVLSNLHEFVRLELSMFKMMDAPLSEGALNEIRQYWLRLGKPTDTLEEFIELIINY